MTHDNTTEFTSIGLVNGDTITNVTLTSPGWASNAPVAGSPYPITFSGSAGKGLANYTITYVSGLLTVIPAALSVAAGPQTKPFGQVLLFGSGSTLFTSTNLQNGETVGSVTLAVSGNGGAAAAPTGTYIITPTNATGGTFNANNYTISYYPGVLMVIIPVPLVTWPDPVPIIYGVALTTNELNATANVAGGFAYTPTNGSVLNAGTNTLTVIFTPGSLIYSNVTNNANLVVSNAPLTVIASNLSRAYGQSNPPFTGAILGVTNGDDITAAYSSDATLTSMVGLYPITAAPVDPNHRLSNYTVNLTNGTLMITQAVPLVTWSNPLTITYGTPFATNQLNATATVPGSFAYSPSPGTILNAGTNAISVIFTPADVVDYLSVTDTVTLVVLPAPLIVTAPCESRAYGQTNPSLIGTITGLVNGDTHYRRLQLQRDQQQPGG